MTVSVCLSCMLDAYMCVHVFCVSKYVPHVFFECIASREGYQHVCVYVASVHVCVHVRECTCVAHDHTHTGNYVSTYTHTLAATHTLKVKSQTIQSSV